jgi:Ca2+-binding RTX toxin-like protein
MTTKNASSPRADKSPTVSGLLSGLLSRFWGPRPGKSPDARRARFESLEPRILLSADFVPAADAMADGLHQFGLRVQDFLGSDAAFAEHVPLLLKVTISEDGETLTSEAPTVGDLLTVPVDANQDGFINRFGDFFDTTDNDEDDLEELDGDNDGFVDAGEFLHEWFFDPVRDFLHDNITSGDLPAEFVNFLKNGLFFQQIDRTFSNLGPYMVDFDTVDAKISDTTEDPDAEFTFTVGIELTVSNSMPIDLGLEADGLKLFAFTGDSLSPLPVKVPVVSKLSFSFEFGVFTGGQEPAQINTGDFFVRKADPLLVNVVAQHGDLDFKLNVGFLGAQVVNGDFDLQADVASKLFDANDPEALGFIDSQHGVESTSGVVTAVNAVPNANLDHAVGLFLRIGNVGITTPVFVADDGASGLNTLESHSHAARASAGLDGLVTTNIDGANKVTFSLPNTSDTPLGFFNESLNLAGVIQATPDGTGANTFDFTSDQVFLLSVAGALPRLVNVRFPNAAQEELGFGAEQDADLPDSVDEIVAPNAPTVFDITGDAHFEVTVTTASGFQHTQSFTLTATDTNLNGDEGDLAADMNAKLDGFLAPLVFVTTEGGKIKFEAFNVANVSAMRVEASGTATSEIGFAPEAQTTLSLTANNNAINSGDLTASATFTVHVTAAGGATSTHYVTVSPEANASVAGLAADVDEALDDAGLAIDAFELGGKIVLQARNVNIAAFDVTVQNQNLDDLVHDVNAALDDAGLDDVTASNAGGQLRLTAAGGESIEITRTLTFDAGVTVNELDFGDKVFEHDEGASTAHATFDLPVKVLPGLEDPLTNDDWNPADVAIVGNFDPFAGDTAKFDPNLNRFTIDFDLTPEMSAQDTPVPAVTSASLSEEARLVNMAELLNFNLLSAENMIGLLNGLGSALQQISAMEMFANYDIPFVDAALSDLFNFTDPNPETASGLIDKILFDIGADGFSGDDVNKLLKKVEKDGQFFLTPTFVTAQEFANKLDDLLGVALEGAGGINATYNTSSNELTYQVDLIAGEDTATSVPADFEYDVALSPFAKLTVDTAAAPADKQVTLEGRTGLAMTFGIDLDPPGMVITEGTALSVLNGGNGVQIKEEHAITGMVDIPVTLPDPNNPPPTFEPVQQLTGNAVFSVSINGGPAVSVTVEATSTYFVDPDTGIVTGNRTLADLAADVNTALAAADLSDELYADYDGRRLVLSARDADVPFEIVTVNFFAEHQLGFEEGADSNEVDFIITDSSGGVHEIVLDDLPANPTVQHVLDAINLQAGPAVTAELNAARTGLRLVDHTGGGGTFRVDSVNGSSALLPDSSDSALLGLGFFLNNSVSAAFADQEGNPHLIEGGAIGETHLDDRFFVRDAVMRIDGLKVTTAPADGVPGQALFGIVGVDTTFDGSLIANVTATIDGGAKTTLAQLFEKVDNSDVPVVDDPVVSKAQELEYVGLGGFAPGVLVKGQTSGATAVVVGVESGIGTGTLTLSHVLGDFVDAELLVVGGFAFNASVGTETVNHAFGEFELGVTVQPGFDDIGFGGDFGLLDGATYVVPVELTGFGDPVDESDPDDDIEPDADLDLTGIGDLGAFEHLSYSHFTGALDGLQALLVDVNANFALFNTTLPAINRSVADLLKLVEGFERSTANARFVLDAADAALDPAGLDLPALTLQNLPQALRGAFGLPNDVDPDGADTVDWVRLDFDQVANELRLDLQLNETLTTKLGLDIEVGDDLPKLTSGGVLKVSGELNIDFDVAIELDTPQNAYLLDSSSISAELHVIGEGQEYSTGEDGAGLVFNASLGPLAVFIQDGDARIGVAFSLGLDFDGSDRKLIPDVTFADFEDVDVTENDIDIVLPMFFGGEGPDDYLGDFSAIGTVALVEVDTPSFEGIVVDITEGDIAFDPFDNMNLAIDTINLYLETLSDTLASQILSTQLPFVGDQLADVLFLEDVRESLVGTLKAGIANAINPDPDTIVVDLLEGLFGAGGELEGYLLGGLASIVAFSNVGNAGVAITDWRRQWNFTLHNSRTVVIDDFDLGIDNLGFDVNVPVEVEFEWTLDFGFGVNFGESAFIDVSGTNELDIDLIITLDSGTHQGEFGYLRVDVTDPGNDSGVEVHFDVDTQNDANLDSSRLGFSDLGAIVAVAEVHGESLGAHAASLHLVTQEVLGLPTMQTDLVIDWALTSTPLEDLEAGDAVTPGVELIELNDIKLDSGSMADALLGPLLDEVGEFIEPFMPVIDTLTAPIPILSDIAGEPFTLLDLAGIFGSVDPAFIETIADILDVIAAIQGFINAPLLDLGDIKLFDVDGGDAGFVPGGAPLSQLEVDNDDDGIPDLGGHTFVLDDYNQVIEDTDFLRALKNEEIADGLKMPILTQPAQGIQLLLGQVADLISYELNPLSVDFSYFQVFPIIGPLAVGIEIGFGFMLDLHEVGFDTFGFQRYADSGFRNEALIFDGFFLGDLEDGVDKPEVEMLFSLIGTAELNLGIARAGVGGGIDAKITFDWHDSIADGNVHLSEIVGNIVAEGGNPLAAFDVGGELTFELFAFIEFLTFRQDIPITGKQTLYSFEDTAERAPVLATKEEDGGTLFLNMGPNALDRLNGDTSDGHEFFELEYQGDGKVTVWSDKLGVAKGDQVYTGVTHIVGLGGQGNDTILLHGFNGSGVTAELDGGVGDDRIEYDASTGLNSVAGARIVGGLGNDKLTGGDANDVIYGGAGNDTIKGGGGYDILFGDQGKVADTVTPEFISSRITTADGDDKIEGGDADDVIFGGGGNDQLKGDTGDDVIIGDGGRFEYTRTGGHVDIASLRPDAYEPTPVTDPVDPDIISNEIDAVYFEMVDVFKATDLGFGGNDQIFGGADDDMILGGSGDDTVKGEGGDDIILGGKGFDDLQGGDDDDSIFGNDQADTIAGNAGDDVISGGAGNDLVHGNTGDDVMKGDTGADVMYGDEDDDQVFGQTEPDILFGGADDDLVVGGTGNDIMFGDDGLVAKIDPDTGTPDRAIGIGNAALATGAFFDDDIRTTDLIVTDVLADDGNDMMSGDAGDDMMFGGGGNDLMGGDVDPRLTSAGSPTEISEDVLIGDGGRVTLDHRQFRKIETVIGADTTGEPFNDVIYGDNGNDYIFGGRGSDFLFGGHGKVVDVDNEEVLGFRGATDAEASDNDIIVGDNGEMLFADDTLVADNFGVLEIVRTTDEADDTGGHEYAEGEIGEDVIFGGVNGSVDVLFGNTGSDVILGDNGELSWNSDGENDLTTLDLIRSYRDGLGGEDHVSGNAGDDVLIGGTAGDLMYGDDATASAGALDGEDIMLGDNADIFLIGNVGRLKVRVADMELGTAVDHITTTDENDDFGGADTMSGNAKADIMFGGVNDGGVDTMYGDRALPDGITIPNDGDDILLGDNGLVDFAVDPDENRNVLDLISSYEDGLGGMDVISGNKGLDVAIGGTAGDEIYGDDLAASAGASDLGDLLLGDNADVFLAAAPVGPLPLVSDLKLVLRPAVPDPLLQPSAVKTIRTTDEEHPEFGGSDTISGNAKGDIIAGGVQGDTLYGDALSVVAALDGDDVILGDNGAFEWLSSGRLGEITGIDILANNPALHAKYNGGAADTDLTTLDLITTEQPTSGGRDTIYGDEGDDLAFGGTDLDFIYGDDNNEGTGTLTTNDNRDVLFGDHGRLYAQFSTLKAPQQHWQEAFNSRNFFAIDVLDDDGGEGDVMYGEEGDDVMLGQQGDDRMWGGSQADDLIGGHNVEGGIDELTLPAVQAVSDPGPDNTNDLMDGGSGNDAMKGDNVIVWRRGDDLSPRFQTLVGTRLYTTGPDGVDTIVANVGGTASDPNDTVGRDIEVVDHADVVPAGRFGDDLMAGGADDDLMLGDLGNDVMQGDGSISAVADAGPNTITTTHTDTGTPDSSGILYFNVPEALTDGDDYIEGSGGDDLIYGGLGQDDIIGGSSSLFGLTTNEERPDGADIIFGGAGAPARLARNDFVGTTDTDTGTADGVGAVPTGNDPQIALADRHSHDADFIMGDNANVYRMVGAGDAYLQFNYDQTSAFENRGNERIVVRAMQQLDYTLGGADYAGGSYANGVANADNGLADLIHGESGDDYIFGMTGSDVIFGESDDDDIVGGYGNDWISGGTGQDGVLGDDGLLYTSRNSTLGEPLYGVAGLLATDAMLKYNNGNALNELISTPGDVQLAVINVAGELKKTADLVPFSFDPEWLGLDDEFPDDVSNTPFADDIIFGGLGGDFLHGGSGDDAISGAEALEHAYVPVFANGVAVGILDLGYDAFDLAPPVEPGDFVPNVNPGNVLRFSSQDLDGQHLNNRFRAGEFFLYDEYDPLRRIELTATGELWKPGDGASFAFVLNFDQTEGIFRASGTVPKATGQQTESYPVAHDDGKDAIFGDLGNDWLVGGTGRDNLYGGWGNDLLNADDDLSTIGDAPKKGDPLVAGANDRPDTHPFYEDRAYGGAGRDVLIANTGGDRLIDWVGEYNSYLVPFAPFGQATVSRTLMPHLHEFLYALSAGDGADATRYADAVDGTPPAPTTNDPIPSRNGEPHGELGLVLQKDFAWQDQTGAPADPQAGNIPGGPRDVLRSAGFQDGSMQGFFVDSGSFAVSSGALQVAATSLGGDAVSVFNVDYALPSYFEMQASVSVIKPTAGWKANSYLIFDYWGEQDFKFAGLDVSNSKLVMGHRDATGWHVDEQASVQGGLKSDTNYNVLLALNGVNATLVVNNKNYFTHTYQPRIDGGISYGFNQGMVGVGSDNSRGSFDNVNVQVLPPKITFQSTEDFSDGVANLMPGSFQSGAWTVQGGRYTGSPAVGGVATSLFDLGIDGLHTSSYLEFSAKINTQTRAGLIFDRYSATDFKFAAIDAVTDQVIIGHSTARGVVVDAFVAKTINAGPSDFYNLGVSIKGSTVSVTLDGQVVLGKVYNAVAVDGDFGLLAVGTPAKFDDVVVKTNDAAFVQAAGSNMVAAEVAAMADSSMLTQSELDTVTMSAMTAWIDRLGDGDSRLAGFGGFQVSVADLGGLALGYTEGRHIWIDRNAAGYGWSMGGVESGRMDLTTVVTHELGNLIGITDNDLSFAVMDEDLEPGVRYLLGAATFDTGGFDSNSSLRSGNDALGQLAQRLTDEWETQRTGTSVTGIPSFDLGGQASGATGGIDWQAGSADGWSGYSPFNATKAMKSAAANFSDYLMKLTGKGGSTPDGSAGYDGLGKSVLGAKGGKGARV